MGHAPSLNLPHGWGAIVAAGNAERGFTEPDLMPNGSRAPHRPADPLTRNTFDAN